MLPKVEMIETSPVEELDSVCRTPVCHVPSKETSILTSNDSADTSGDLEIRLIPSNGLDRKSHPDDIQEYLLPSPDCGAGSCSGDLKNGTDLEGVRLLASDLGIGSLRERRFENTSRAFADENGGSGQDSNDIQFHGSCDLGCHETMPSDLENPNSDPELTTSDLEEDNPFYDGGYGWVIVAASFVGQIMYPIGYSYGLFNIVLLDYFGKTKAATALVGSLCYTFLAGAGLLASVLSNWLGHRTTVILGSLLTAAGYLISAFSPSLPVLYFTYGVMIGTGVSLQTVPTNVMVSFYFKKRRNLATGIMSSGSGIGGIILPLLIQYFIEIYSWRGAMIMLAGLSLHGCISGALLRPNERLKRRQDSDTAQKVKIFDLSLFRKWAFPVILLMFLAEGFQTLIFFTMFPHRVVQYGFTQDQAAFLLFLIGIGSTLSRVIVGALMHFFNLDISIVFATSVIGMGLANLTATFQHPVLWPLVIAALVFGAMLGVMAYLIPLYACDLFGLRRVTSAFGYVVIGEAIGGFSGPALAGFLYDKTGDYQIAFAIAFSSALCSGLLNIPLYLYRNRWRKLNNELSIVD